VSRRAGKHHLTTARRKLAKATVRNGGCSAWWRLCDPEADEGFRCGRQDRPGKADATLGRLRRGREINTEKQHEESRRNTMGRITAASARLRLAKQHLDAEHSRYVDRVDALRVGAYEAECSLPRWPRPGLLTSIA
jgi:hypothetical protein